MRRGLGVSPPGEGGCGAGAGAGAAGGKSLLPALRFQPTENRGRSTAKVIFGEVGPRFVGCNMEATGGTEELVSGELVSVAHALSLPAESYGNDPDIEMAWAMRAMQHAEIYYKVSCLCSL